LYLYGIFLLTKLPSSTLLQTKEYVLNIFVLAYLLLGICSLINTLLFAKKTNQYFKAVCIFLGIQVIFWMIGNTLGNNYFLLAAYFLLFLILAVYGNLKALSFLQKPYHKNKLEQKNT
jgi:hypothetical protein